MQPSAPFSAFIRNGQAFIGPNSVGTQNEIFVTNGDGTTSWANTIQLGDLGAQNSVDPVITISRNVNSGDTNGHAFSDSSFFNRDGFAYNSFDARITFGASGHTYDHYSSFQSQPTILAGTLNLYYGTYSKLIVAGAATVITAYHHYVADYSGADTTGAVGAQYGLYCADLSSTGQSYSLFSAGSSVVMDHAGPVVLRSTLKMMSVPTSDPHVVGEVWNSGGTLKLSAG